MRPVKSRNLTKKINKQQRVHSNLELDLQVSCTFVRWGGEYGSPAEVLPMAHQRREAERMLRTGVRVSSGWRIGSHPAEEPSYI